MDLALELDYKMDHPRRGKAIIFNHYKFKDPEMTRDGTHLDEDLFCQVLLTWGFQPPDITILSDFTLKEIKEYLYNASKMDYSDCDVFVCAVFTHGERNSLYSFDTLFNTSQMWKHFTDDECPSLKGRPKLFFVQACRGSKLDRGVKVKDPKTKSKSKKNKNSERSSNDKIDSAVNQPENEEETLSCGNITSPTEDHSEFAVLEKQNSIENLPISINYRPTTNLQFRIASENSLDRSGSSAELPFSPKKSKSIDKIPVEWKKDQSETTDVTSFGTGDFSQSPHTDPDILVAYSTADGYYSFRHPVWGSWFISKLHDVVMSDMGRSDRDLMDILTEVNLQVSVDKISQVTIEKLKFLDKKKQVLCFQSTLTKRLYFTKKLNT